MKRPSDKNIHLAVKVIMTAIFLWSGFFWSGVTMLNFFINNTEYSYLSVQFLAGSLILLLSLLLCWFRFYILQIIPCVIGLIVFLRPAREMIDHAAETGILFKPTFELRYLPIIGFAILSAALLMVRIWELAAAHIERQDEFNNRPTESVLDKHREE